MMSTMQVIEAHVEGASSAVRQRTTFPAASGHALAPGLKSALCLFGLLVSLSSVAACGDDDVTPEVPVAMPRGQENPPMLGAQLDRTGRPAISTTLIATFNGDDAAKAALKNQYNAASDRSTWAEDFQGEIASNLAILDSLDEICGNQLLAAEEVAGEVPADRYSGLAGVLADDRLYVNTAFSAEEDSSQCGQYLGVEAEFTGAVDAGVGRCGGRTPLDDVVERSYSVLAAGLLAGVNDGVTEDGDGSMHSATVFPFVAAPMMSDASMDDMEATM